MDTKTFIIATNGRLKWWLQHTLSGLSPEQLHYRTPLIDDRPIAEVAMHATIILLGNATVAAGKHWPLEDYPLDGWPPRLAQPVSAAALVETLDTLLAQVDELVQQVPVDALDKEVTFPWGQQQAGDALSAGLVPPWAPEDFGVANRPDVAWMTPRLTPMPLLTHAEKLHAPTMKAKKLPRSFIHCRQFGLGAFGEKIRREGGTVFGLNTGHDAMITQPQELAAILFKQT